MTNDPLIGRQLANYRIERLIGRGGMATVYYATDVRLNRPVAIKVIDPHFRAKDSYTARFVQEAQAVATWRHEHIVQVYYAGDVDGLYYFAMEYIDGTTLAQILFDQTTRGQLLPAADVLRYGRAIASALDYAHQKGVIHRDVKPLNVLVASDGRVVLTDFGLALDTNQGSLGEAFGTAHYTAPEQARRSNSAVPQSDLYSLGVMLYEMLTGVVPFDDPSPTSVALQQITQPPPPPRQINPNLSAAVEAVLLRALEKGPAERYPTGMALMDSLETALKAPHTTGLPISGQPTPPPLPPIPASAPHPTPAAAAPLASKPEAPRRAGWTSWIALIAILCLGLSAAAVIAGLGLKGTLAAKKTPTTLPPESASITLATADLTAILSTPQPAISSPIPGDAPTQPPSQTQTPLPLLSDTPPGQPAPPATDPAPSPTLKYTDRRKFILYYNETGFYMKQLSGVGDLIAGVAFERLDANGKTLNRFSGNKWAEYSQSSLLDWCFRLEIAGAGNYLRPPECEGKFLATLHLPLGDPMVFWTPQADSQVFRVLWRDEELVRCEIAAGTCEMYLP